jgi:hypothetical protein
VKEEALLLHMGSYLNNLKRTNETAYLLDYNNLINIADILVEQEFLL